MPRTSINDDDKLTGNQETPFKVAYSKNSTIEEIVDGIRSLKATGTGIKENSSLRGATEYLLNLYDKKINLSDIDALEEFLGELPAKDTIGKIEAKLAEAKEAAAAENEEPVENRLTQAQVEELEDLYDKHQGNLREIEAEAAKNPLLKKSNVRETVEKMQLLESEKAKRGWKEEAARESAERQVEAEAALEDRGIEPKKAEVLASEIENKAELDKEINRKEIASALNEAAEEAEVGRALEVAEAVLAKKKIEEEIEVIVDKTTAKLFEDNQISNKEGEEIKQILRENLLAQTSDPTTVKSAEEVAIQITKAAKIESGVIGKTIALETFKSFDDFTAKNEKAILAVSAEEQYKQLIDSFYQKNPTANGEQAGAMRQFAHFAAYELPQAGLDREAGVNHVIGMKDENGNVMNRVDAVDKMNNFEGAWRVVKSGKQGAERLVGLRNNLSRLGIQVPYEDKIFKPLDSMSRLLMGDKNLARAIGAIKNKMEFWESFENGIIYKGITKLGGEKAAVWLGQQIGGQAGKVLAEQGLEIMAKQGFQKGIQTILGQLLKTGGKVGLDLAAKGAEGALAAGEAATGPVGWVLLAAQAIYEAAKFILSKAKVVVEKVLEIFGIDLPGMKAKVEDFLGGSGVKAVAILGLVPAAAAAMISSATLFVMGLIPWVIGSLIVGGVAYIMLVPMNLNSIMKPPEGMGGAEQCILKTAAPSNPNGINCDQNAPANSFPGMVSKDTFTGVANRWHSGTNYAAECFYDVVNRSLCAGINPAFALFDWAHESGASNYSVGNKVEDFGVHFINKPEDFNAQITAFLKIDAGQTCAGAPGIGSNYWLGFAADYLNGDCNPDEVNPISHETPRQYLTQIQGEWNLVSSSPLPASIHVSPGGQNCGGTPATSSDHKEITAPNGQIWVCPVGVGTNIGGSDQESMIPATPIYDENCTDSPAWCVVNYLTSNGVKAVTRADVTAAESLIDQWKNAPASFNKGNFNSAMANSTAAYDGFQCVGFAVGVNPTVGSPAWGGDPNSWETMIAHGSSACPRIDPKGAGVGDFILFPVGDWFHIQVLSKLSADGSYDISQANWGGLGVLSNVHGGDLQSYLSGKSVLRCH